MFGKIFVTKEFSYAENKFPRVVEHSFDPIYTAIS